MKPIYQNGSIVDYSDEGQFVKELNNRIDMCYALKMLSPRQKRVIEMITQGYSRREVMKELNIGQHTIENLFKRLQNIINLVE